MIIIIIFNRLKGGVRILYPCPNTYSVRRTPCDIIRTPYMVYIYIQLYNIYIIDEPIR